jgi:hypothetical protein
MPSVASALVALGFAATGAIQLLGFLQSARYPNSPGCRADRVDQLGHALMSVEMATMIGTESTADRWGIQAAVLLIITGWFAVRAAGGRPGLFSHALTAAAMTGMLALPPGTAPQTGGPGAEAAMSGMPMPHGPTSGSHLGALVGGCLLINAAGWVTVAYRAGRRVTAAKSSSHVTAPRSSRRVMGGPLAGALVHAAMAAGMAVMLLPPR